MSILLESHTRKRARLVRDEQFISFFNAVSLRGLTETETPEAFVDEIAEKYDPTFLGANSNQGSDFIDYIIDNLQNGIINYNDATALFCQRILRHYRELVTKNKLTSEFINRFRNITDLSVELKKIYKENSILLKGSAHFRALYSKMLESMQGRDNVSIDFFYNEIKNNFDPTSDGRYMGYIVDQLVDKADRPAVITLQDAEYVKLLLNAHLTQVENNNKDIKYIDIFRYKKIFPDLDREMKQYLPNFNFDNNKCPNFVQTQQKFLPELGEPIYQNVKFQFYKIPNRAVAAKVIPNRRRFDEWIQTQQYNAGYWCVADMYDYFPTYIAVDVYGFCSYAIVPKSRGGWRGEIKNRFNSKATCLTMNNSDYDALYDFFVSDTVSDVLEQFKHCFQFTDEPYYDVSKFLARAPTVDAMNTLLGTNEETLFDVIYRFLNGSPNTYITKILGAAHTLKSFVSVNPRGFPLFNFLRNINSPTITVDLLRDTPLDLKYAARSQVKAVSRNLASVINNFKANTIESFNRRPGDYKYIVECILGNHGISEIQRNNPALIESLDTQLSKKIADDTLRFGGDLKYVFIEHTLTNETAVLKKTQKELKKSRDFYIRTEAIERDIDSQIANDVLIHIDAISQYNTMLHVVESLFIQKLIDSQISANARNNITKYIAERLKWMILNEKDVRGFNISYTISSWAGAHEVEVKAKILGICAKGILEHTRPYSIAKRKGFTVIKKALFVEEEYIQNIRKINNISPEAVYYDATANVKSPARRVYPELLNFVAASDNRLTNVIRHIKNSSDTTETSDNLVSTIDGYTGESEQHRIGFTPDLKIKLKSALLSTISKTNISVENLILATDVDYGAKIKFIELYNKIINELEFKPAYALVQLSNDGRSIKESLIVGKIKNDSTIWISMFSDEPIRQYRDTYYRTFPTVNSFLLNYDINTSVLENNNLFDNVNTRNAFNKYCLYVEKFKNDD